MRQKGSHTKARTRPRFKNWQRVVEPSAMYINKRGAIKSHIYLFSIERLFCSTRRRTSVFLHPTPTCVRVCIACTSAKKTAKSYARYGNSITSTAALHRCAENYQHGTRAVYVCLSFLHNTTENDTSSEQWAENEQLIGRSDALCG